MKISLLFLLSIFSIIGSTQDWELLVKDANRNNEIKIQEGKKIKVWETDSIQGSEIVKGKFTIIDSTCILINTDTVFVQNIDKIRAPNFQDRIVTSIWGISPVLVLFGGIISDLIHWDDSFFGVGFVVSGLAAPIAIPAICIFSKGKKRKIPDDWIIIIK